VKDLFITNNLTKAFGGLVAVNEVSLTIKENTFTLLIGPNGSGKTTFLNICTGVLSPDGGEVKFEDKDITGWSPESIYELGFVRTFQIPMPFLSLTVLDNVLSAMKNPGESPLKAVAKGTWVKEEEKNVERALEILWRVGLYKDWDKPAYSLGGAQLKMLEISRSLASGAKLVALDEPIGGVDPIYADEILTYIARLKGYGLTFLVIEHRIDIVVPFADYAYAMDRGSVISQGKPQDVLNDPKVIEIYIG